MIESSIKLDSHTNMPVVGASAYIISDTGETADVNAYSPEYESRNIKIVDAALKYEILHDNKHLSVTKRTICTIYEKQFDTTLHHEGGWYEYKQNT